MNDEHVAETVERLTDLLGRTLKAGASLDTYLRVIKGFVPFSRHLAPERDCDKVAAYYEQAVGLPPYEKPDGAYAMRMARGVLMLRDALEGKPPAARYFTPGRSYPCGFGAHAARCETWMRSSGMSECTIDSRLGRLMPLALFLEEEGLERLQALDASAESEERCAIAFPALRLGGADKLLDGFRLHVYRYVEVLHGDLHACVSEQH